MNHKRTIVALAVIMMAAVPMSILMADESDAGMSFDKIWGEGFSNTSDGTLFVSLKNTEYSDQEVKITVTEGSRELAKKTVTIPAQTTYTAELRFGIGGLGDHILTVTCEPADLFPGPGGTHYNSETVTVNVTESIWSKPTTYAALIVVAILIVIAFYLRMRNAPATKPDTTFTELDRQQKGSRAKAEDAPKTSATERKRYGGPDEPPKETKKQPPAKPPEPPAEKKATSFTELEKEKSAKKEAAPKKESSSGEPKKLKYVSSRRK
ncbi:MAG: hypothetical protein FWG60_01990 [Methanomassiliicoccaceae archaeon]|nr:hypothetical protein [Methanomassiliicoccaceae archaeon]